MFTFNNPHREPQKYLKRTRNGPQGPWEETREEGDQNRPLEAELQREGQPKAGAGKNERLMERRNCENFIKPTLIHGKGGKDDQRLPTFKSGTKYCAYFAIL